MYVYSLVWCASLAASSKTKPGLSSMSLWRSRIVYVTRGGGGGCLYSPVSTSTWSRLIRATQRALHASSVLVISEIVFGIALQRFANIDLLCWARS